MGNNRNSELKQNTFYERVCGFLAPGHIERSGEVSIQCEQPMFVLSEAEICRIIVNQDIYPAAVKIVDAENLNANQLDTPKP